MGLEGGRVAVRLRGAFVRTSPAFRRNRLLGRRLKAVLQPTLGRFGDALRRDVNVLLSVRRTRGFCCAVPRWSPAFRRNRRFRRRLKAQLQQRLRRLGDAFGLNGIRARISLGGDRSTGGPLPPLERTPPRIAFLVTPSALRQRPPNPHGAQLSD